MKPFSRCAVLGLLFAAACGGNSPNQPQTPPTTTLAPAPPTTTTLPPPTTTTLPPDSAQSKCGTLAPGPVVRYAIAPREQRANAEVVEMMVRAKPGFDEVWCIDKDKEHRLDFNSNQRNASGQECCWTNDPEWDFDDPDKMVVQGGTIANTNGFNYRLRINPRGARGTVYVQASIDGVKSYEWQSSSGYKQGPLRIVSMSANEIGRECQCIFRGNGIYDGDRCPK